jgi:hypothetical protein
VSRRSTGRVTRQILSGSQLVPPRDSFGGDSTAASPASLAYKYLVGLAVLVIAAALVWALWGMGPASIILLVLAIGLVASWLVL